MQKASGIGRLQDASDVNVSLGAGVDGYTLTYDHASGKFVLSAVSGVGISKIQDADDVNFSLGAGVDGYTVNYDHDTGKFVLTAPVVADISTCLLKDGSTVGASGAAQAFTLGVKSGLLFPASDSTTAIKFAKADGSTAVLTIDTTNGRVGIGCTPTATFEMSASGVGKPDFVFDPQDNSYGGFRTKTDSQRLIFAGASVPNYAYGAHFQLVGNSWSGSANMKGRINFAAGNPSAPIGFEGSITFVTANNKIRMVVLADGSVGVGLDTGFPGTMFDINYPSAVTNAVSNVLTVRHSSSGTPAVGFGAALIFGLESSTTENQSAGRVYAVWAEATHATRKAQVVLTAYDTAEREGLRIGANGSAATIGFLGATPSARLAHVADASTAHAITDPGDSPADADALREDLVTNTIPDIESKLNALGTSINSILTTLETFGLHATS